MRLRSEQKQSTDTNTYIDLKVRKLEFLGSSLDDLKEFPKGVRITAGEELRRIQKGERPLHGRPIKTIGAGSFEIKIRDSLGAFRIFYVAKFSDTVYVLHAFKKKSQQTKRNDIKLGKQRYQGMLDLKKNEKRAD